VLALIGRALGRLADWLCSLPGEPHDLFGPTCGFLGCTNPTEGYYSWEMCADCYDETCEWDDSEMILDGSW
jgi:hypothetical protein